MFHLLLAAAVAPTWLAAEASLEVGTQLSYRGAIGPAASETDTAPKTFDLNFWILAGQDSSRDLLWLLDERGAGQFPWPARFGRVTLDARLDTAENQPAALYDRGEGQSVVPLRLPFLAAGEPLAAGTQFADGDLKYRVEKPTQAAGQAVWQINVNDRFGPKRTLFVAQNSPLVVSMREKVIMGRGEEYRLTLELVTHERLRDEQLTSLAAASRQLLGLRDKLRLAARAQKIDWKPEQLKLLAERLPAAGKASAGTGLSKLAMAAQRDLELQSGRSDALAGMQAKFEGSPVEAFAARGLAGDELAQTDLDGNVTVLHFWDYRGEPLHEPYGQVGYLDFLYHRHKPAGLRLYGVAVNGRLADEATRGAAERSVRKLKSFMNLSYPILLDGGRLLKQFGDPRIVGGNLPLFVVIGPDSKIVHYHVGHYDVHQEAGLKQLDEVVRAALGAK